MPEERAEHLAFCKRRALEYLDRGDIQNAVTSMGSDLSKHPETKAHYTLLMLGMRYILDNDAEGARRWIEGFR
jgi:Tfp pilus assembly protein PilF